MDQNINPNEFSGQIQRSVEAAVNSINHMVSDIKNTSANSTRPLGQEVNQSVKNAVDEIKTQFYASFQAQQGVNPGQPGARMNPDMYSRYAQQQQLKMAYQQRFRMENPRQVAPVKIKKKAKKFPGEEANASALVGLTIGTVILGFFSLACLSDETSIAVSLLFLIPFIACVLGLIKSKKKKRRYKRFREYINRFSSQPSYSMQEIMNTFGYSRSTIQSDWQEMIKLGIFPQAHFSLDGETIFLSNAAYLNYQNQMMGQKVGSSAAFNMQDMANETPKNQPQQAQTVNQGATGTEQPSELQNTLLQGRKYIEQIRVANEAIPGEVVSKKLDTLEDVCKRIFSVVEAHPEKLSEIRKFMDYYMPTTLKLVRTYREFEEQRLEGDQIAQTKQDIEGTLDMINIAFANLLNDMYQDQAVQASADISVLSALFSQDGLKNSEFGPMQMPQSTDTKMESNPYADSGNIELKL